MRAFLEVSLATLVFVGVAGAQVHPGTANPSKDSEGLLRSPAVDRGGYLYTSGQSGSRPDGTLPDGFAEQAQQALENLKTLITASGLTMGNVVYVQVHLLDASNYSDLTEQFKKYFPTAPPAGAVLGVARLPLGAVQISAVAVRDLAGRKVIVPATYKSEGPFSPGILTHDRLFVSAQAGRDQASGKIPEDPAAQTEMALDGLKAVAEAAGLTLKNYVFVNPFLTAQIPTRIMNERYARRFEFGNTPGRATIQVAALPESAQIEFTGVAVRDLNLRRAVRPKNMPPSPTASPCVFAGDTLYCSAKSGFIPGPNGGVYASSTGTQLRQTMRNQLDNLEEAGMNFGDVVSTTVYLDDLGDSEEFNKVYREYFGGVLPARTMVQQVASTKREADQQGRYPDLEQLSLIAVRRSAAE
jgi:2-iminobutanoate/2-iminopropanoate deaminase